MGNGINVKLGYHDFSIFNRPTKGMKINGLYLAVCRTIVILNYNGFNTVMEIYSPATYARVGARK